MAAKKTKQKQVQPLQALVTVHKKTRRAARGPEITRRRGFHVRELLRAQKRDGPPGYERGDEENVSECEELAPDYEEKSGSFVPSAAVPSFQLPIRAAQPVIAPSTPTAQHVTEQADLVAQVEALKVTCAQQAAKLHEQDCELHEQGAQIARAEKANNSLITSVHEKHELVEALSGRVIGLTRERKGLKCLVQELKCEVEGLKYEMEEKEEVHELQLKLGDASWDRRFYSRKW